MPIGSFLPASQKLVHRFELLNIVSIAKSIHVLAWECAAAQLTLFS